MLCQHVDTAEPISPPSNQPSEVDAVGGVISVPLENGTKSVPNRNGYGSRHTFDTKFDLRQSVELPWNENFLAVPARAPHGQRPKLGSLHASMMREGSAEVKGC